MHDACTCSVYACTMRAYAVCSAYTYEKTQINHMDRMRMFSIGMHRACVCSACACAVHAYNLHVHARCKCMLSIRMSTPQHFERTLTLF